MRRSEPVAIGVEDLEFGAAQWSATPSVFSREEGRAVSYDGGRLARDLTLPALPRTPLLKSTADSGPAIRRVRAAALRRAGTERIKQNRANKQ